MNNLAPMRNCPRDARQAKLDAEVSLRIFQTGMNLDSCDFWSV